MYMHTMQVLCTVYPQHHVMQYTLIPLYRMYRVLRGDGETGSGEEVEVGRLQGV